MKPFLESCCTTLAEVLNAQKLGADRIELCENLPVGGVTPSRELLENVLANATVPVNVLVRPRGGDFVFNEEETRQMLESIKLCKSLCINGKKVNAVVIGALDPSGNVDLPTMKALIACARPELQITFHRAFDVCAGPQKAFEDVISLGCERLLTSGHEPDAWSGRELLKELVAKASRQIIILCGSGVRKGNIEALESFTGASEFHASASFWK